MWSTSALRVLAMVGAVICLIGVVLAVLLGTGLAAREPAAEWLIVATAVTLGVVVTVFASVSLARRPKTT